MGSFELIAITLLLGDRHIIFYAYKAFLFFFQVKNNFTVDGIDFYVADAFGEGLYESCKDVKFGTMNTRALNFIGAGAQNFKGKFII